VRNLACLCANSWLTITGTPIPNLSDNSDDEMADVPPSNVATPRDEEEEPDGNDDEDEDPEEAEEGATPARDSATPSRSATPRRSARSSTLLPRKRRLGRPPKSRNLGSDDDRNDAPSDTGTPKRRGGFRGRGSGYGRWGKPKGGPSHATQVPIDKEGNMLDVVDDEIKLPDDPDGETKVDKLGYLQDGREYRVRTFTLLGRGKRLYMLSTEPARCIGFRDSYLFFQKHKLLYKIIIDDEEKRDLIDRDLIPHSYKGRAIGVVTARSVFREFGAKIVIGGKKIIDDYLVQDAKARGDVEGELAVPEDRLPLPGEPYNRNQYVAWHGASNVYHTGAPSVPAISGKATDGKKRRVAVTSDNWMFEHAREARYETASSQPTPLLLTFLVVLMDS
jgi:chromatin structure-remodeling complex protein RSC7